MASYSVRPLPDGIDQRSSWQVTGPGGRISTHTKKSAAKTRARQAASDGDQLKIHGTDGVLQKSVNVRNASGGSSNSKRNGGGPFSLEWAETRIDLGIGYDDK